MLTLKRLARTEQKATEPKTSNNTMTPNHFTLLITHSDQVGVASCRPALSGTNAAWFFK
jgi:tRNA U34 5-carboxymethylaminomethyl modifying enzyme MnmG/GidA